MISVIVPVYKVEPYLARCVDSILAQTYTDFELILVDDGSPDNCGIICDEYAKKDSRVRVIHQQNGGLSAARNAGLEAAKGSFITFIDSDDFIDQHALEQLYGALASNKADVAVSAFFRFTNESEITAPNQIEAGVRCISGEEACQEIYRKDYIKFTTSWGKLYRADLFRDVRFPVGKINEDEATTYKLYLASEKVAVLKDQLYYYRFNPNGIMQTKTFSNAADYYEALEERERIFRSRGLDDLADSTAGHLAWRMTEDALLAKAVHQHRRIPKKYRIPIPIALRRMYHNVEHEQFVQYLGMAYPMLVKPFEAFYRLTHKS